MTKTPACDQQAAARASSPEKGALLLLHGSAGSSALWRATSEYFATLYNVVTPDLFGYGGAPAWPPGRTLTLEDEVLRVEASLPCCEGSLDVVGYSYGGAVALALALADPMRINTLTLVEPVVFAALRHAGKAEELRALAELRGRFADALARGDRDGAMRGFIDFWTGPDAWGRMPDRHRAAALGMADKILLDWQASFSFDFDLHALRRLAGRTLLVRGDRSPAPMMALVDALHDAMPGSTHTVIRGAGHLLPLTHDRQLGAALAAHLHAAEERKIR